MAEHRYTTQLKELKQEEGLLKTIKDKLVDQLQRLKVEELALVNYISGDNSSNLSQTSSSTATLFNMKDCTSETDTMNEEVNSVLLPDLSESLTINSLVSSSQPGVEEEEEDDDD